MAWIASHQSLEEHPKTLDLTARMGWTRAETIGRLHMLWWWCLDYAIDGDLSRFTPAQIAGAMDVPALDGERLVRALVEIRWLDDAPRLRIHGWWEHAGLFLKSKWKKNPARFRQVQHWYSEPVTLPTAAFPKAASIPCPAPSPAPGAGPLTQPTEPTEQTKQTEPTHPPAGRSFGPAAFPQSEAEAGKIGEMMMIPSVFAVELWNRTRGRDVKNFAAYLKAAWQRHVEAGGAAPAEPASDKPTVNPKLL